MTNPLREQLKQDKQLHGALVSLTDPCLCEIMGRVGFDCVWIDMEHTYMTPRDVLCHLNAARASGIATLVRLPQNDLTVTKQILEMGPDGILFPMVRSAEEAEELLSMTLYPPLGTRGFGPMRAIEYGAADAKEYTDRKSLELCRMIQIEHVNCIRELETLAQNPYLDGFVFGPNDLSGSVGKMMQVFDSEVVSLIRQATELLHAHGKRVGIACGADSKTLAFWSQFGFDMVFAGADWNYVFSAGIQALATLRENDPHAR